VNAEVVCRVRHVFLRVSIYHVIDILQVPDPAGWRRLSETNGLPQARVTERSVQRCSGMARSGSINTREKAALPRQSTANARGDVQVFDYNFGEWIGTLIRALN